MLCLLGVMLSVLCLVSSAPLPTDPACPNSTLFKETIEAIQNLTSKGSSDIVLLSNTMEAGGDATTYLEGFIEALEKAKENVPLRGLIFAHLQKIKDYGKSCTGWTSALKEDEWELVEDYDFFENLEYFLRFLGENANPELKN